MTVRGKAGGRGLLIAISFLCVSGAVRAQVSRFDSLEAELPFMDRLPWLAVRAVGDFNGDLIADLVRADDVFLNDGAGAFTSAGNLYANFPAAVAVDFNLDGNLDLLTLDYGTQPEIAVNTGGGQFVYPPLPLPTFSGTHSADRFHVCDFDGDLFPDIIVENQGYGVLQLFAWRNLSGLGYASLPPTQPPLNDPVFVASGDFDGDGSAEIVVCEALTPLQDHWDIVMLKYTGGLLVRGAPYPIVGGAAVGGAADWNGDGYADLLISIPPATQGAPATSAFFAGGPTGLATTPQWTAVGERVTGIIPFELDGTAPPEVILTAPGAITVLSVGAPGLIPLVEVPGAPVGDALTVAADFDGDGDQDLLVAMATGTERIVFNVGGVLIDPTGTFDGRFGRGAMTVFGADIDGDADVDFVTHDLRRAEINDGFGNFTYTTGQPPAGPLPTVLGAGCVGDFDGDGRADYFAGAMTAVDTHQLFLSRPGPSWVRVPVPSPSIAALQAVATDIDGDGDLDIVVLGTTIPWPPWQQPLPWFMRVELLRNHGGGVFTVELLHLAEETYRFAIADFDGDGDPDIVLGSGSTNPPRPVVWLRNDGSTFVPIATTLNLSAALICAADLEGDGDVDLVLNGQAYVRNGNTWTPAGAPPVFVPSNVQELHDLDGDGRLDLIVDLYWNPGLGAAGFGPPELLNPLGSLPAAPPSRYVVGDFDRDGDLDVMPGSAFILWNMTRHLERTTAVRPGRSSTMRVHGDPGTATLLVASAARLAHPLALGAFGDLVIDPAPILWSQWMAIDASGVATITLACPSDLGLVGVSFWWQALLPGQAHLTGARETQVLGY